MSASLARACAALFAASLCIACGRGTPETTRVPPAAQIAGTLQVDGMTAPVTVSRDHFGIPHITASNIDDLFFAQGFVQAQDRLFQMDLWKRAAQGRLSEVLGANFIERDAMTRRMQFRGDLDREWESYGPDTRRIAAAFTRGINAWVRIALDSVPEEFQLAGWLPEFWRPEDLLNRTDAFLASGTAQDDLLRARLSAQIGAERVNRLLPRDGQSARIDPGIDASAITYVVPDALRRVGTPAFFSALQGRVTDAPRPGATEHAQSRPDTSRRPDAASDVEAAPNSIVAHVPQGGGVAFAISKAQSATGVPLVAFDAYSRFAAPSLWYLVHLSAPGWNVAGATSPWLPGVIVGHNDRIAWAIVQRPLDTQDVFVERVNPDNPHQVERDDRWVDMTIDYERIDVKGRARPFEYERLYTSNGAVIGLDRQRHLAYTLKWSGTEPGGAADLAAIAVDRARDWTAFRAALARWKMPVARFVYADKEGHVASADAGLLPVRAHDGSVPVAGWLSSNAWRGSESLEARTEAATPGARTIVGAEPSDSRLARMAELLDHAPGYTIDDARRALMDLKEPDADVLVGALGRVRTVPRELQPARDRLLAWDREATNGSRDASLYRRWTDAMRRLIAQRSGVPSEFAADVAARLDLPALVTRRQMIPGVDVGGELLLEALRNATESQDASVASNAANTAVVFEHPLGIFDAVRRRFNVGPVAPPGGSPRTVFATDGRTGAVLRAIFDLSNWDRSVIVNAPGQSGSASSPHYGDLASTWATGDYVPFAFGPEAVNAAASNSLVLAPAK